jgi:C4-dicarboxylate transporter DctQ subunit
MSAPDATRAEAGVFSRILAAWDWVERTLVGVLGACAMGIAAVQVFGRYVAPGAAITWAEEVIVYIAVWAVMIIASQLVRTDAMVRPDLVLRYGWKVVGTAILLDQRSSSDLQFPLWIYYTALPAGGALMLGRYLIRLARYAFFFDPHTMTVGHIPAHEAPAALTQTIVK